MFATVILSIQSTGYLSVTFLFCVYNHKQAYLFCNIIICMILTLLPRISHSKCIDSDLVAYLLVLLYYFKLCAVLCNNLSDGSGLMRL